MKKKVCLLLVMALAFQVFAVAGAYADARREFIFSGGPAGGTHFAAAGGGVIIFNQYMETGRWTYGPSAGSVETVRRIGSQEYDVGFAHINTLWEALNGEGMFEGNRLENLRILAKTETLTLLWFTLHGSDIISVSDFVGRGVNMSNPGSGTHVHTTQIFDALGLTDQVRTSNLHFADGGRALLDGHLDVAVSIGNPYSSAVISEVSMQRPIQFIEFTDEEIEVLSNEFPFYQRVTVPGGLVPGVDDPVNVLGWSVFWVAHADVPEEVIYEVLTLAEEHRAVLTSVQSAWGDVAPEFDNLDWGIKLHPGAVRFWQDRGVEISPGMIP